MNRIAVWIVIIAGIVITMVIIAVPVIVYSRWMNDVQHGIDILVERQQCEEAYWRAVLRTEDPAERDSLLDALEAYIEAGRPLPCPL